jgi:single-stranded-DNA-specific exonuclease
VLARGILDPKGVDLKRYLDLVTLGTISDMGALLGENRIFVRYGLKEIVQRQRVGLAKLLEVCDLETKSISTADIASKLAPRLNSLGRIDDPNKGVELLLLRDAQKAEKMAVELDLNNIERQKIERTASEDIDRSLEENPDILNDRAIVLHSDQWHPGVIAIVATRLSKFYHRPTAIIALENGIGKGSVRSIPDFSLMDAFGKCSDLLLNYGGHDIAAGLTIKEENIEEFRKRFVSLANTQLTAEDVHPKIFLDAEVEFTDLTFEFMESLKLLEPYGNENPAPILYTATTQAWPPKIIGKNHLKVYLEQDDRILEGIGFGMGNRCADLRKKEMQLCSAFTPQINNFQNKASIQLVVKDFQEQ